MENQQFSGSTTNNVGNNPNLMGLPPVPNSVAVLVLGILSIVFCWCYGIISLILGIIALVLASKGQKLYQESPQAYAISSFNNLKAGKICAIIGTILSGLYLIFIIIYIIILGAAISTMPWQMFR